MSSNCNKVPLCSSAQRDGVDVGAERGFIPRVAMGFGAEPHLVTFMKFYELYEIYEIA